ncbi:hypothetical protein B2G71_08680 [Novosphingobium sp. PC22D]|uniref:carboxymuconolactone decarboxylase family protein n=1 Tax=Novosphingobium sp. PC22D TaxID=1962403 RepID=UPI000BEF59D8|nr:carboxymuconolactone decarboxylase family protein [Novosphingobium sp. PC22D]PEQ12907.1 hypothetical protein B2G71_08680 [Novosphingobium sp. PC22D]
MKPDPDIDIAARQAQVVGAGPRLEPLPGDALDQQAIDLILNVRASAGAGAMDEVPEFMRTVVRNPELFRAQMDIGNVFYNGRIPAREREIAVLRIAWLCGAPYEWGQHVAIARRCGVSDAEIARAKLGSAAEGWSAHDAAIVRGVEELIADKTLGDATWDQLAATWDEAQLVEFPALVGQYVSIAYVQNTLRIRLDEGNPGLAAT